MSIDSIFDYTQSYQETLCFKIKSVLANYFPFLFTSPNKILEERLECLTAIKEKIEEEYQNVPTRGEIDLTYEKNLIEKYTQDFHKQIDEYDQLEKTIGEILTQIKPICERSQDLSNEKDRLEIADLLTPLKLSSVPEDYALNQEDQAWLTQLEQKNLPIGFRSRLKNILRYVTNIPQFKQEAKKRLEQLQKECQEKIAKLEHDKQASKKTPD